MKSLRVKKIILAMVFTIAIGFFLCVGMARAETPAPEPMQWAIPPYTLPSSIAMDIIPPSPSPMDWDVLPREVYLSGGQFGYAASMTAAEATDDSGGAVVYYFECPEAPVFNSRWQADREYTVRVGQSGHAYRFRVKARDLFGNETGWSYPPYPAWSW